MANKIDKKRFWARLWDRLFRQKSIFGRFWGPRGDPKMVQNGSKMSPKRNQNGVKLEARWRKCLQASKWTPNGAQDWPGPESFTPWSTFLEPVWEPQNQNKINFVLHRIPRGNFCIDFCCNRGLSIFSAFLERFSLKKRWYSTRFFQCLLVFFPTSWPSRYIV